MKNGKIVMILILLSALFCFCGCVFARKEVKKKVEFPSRAASFASLKEERSQPPPESGEISANAQRVEGVAVIINDSTAITNYELLLWRKILEKNIFRSEIFERNEYIRFANELVDLYLFAEEAARELEKRLNPELTLEDKLAYYSDPAFWLKFLFKKEKFKKDSEATTKQERQKKKLLAKLLGFPSYNIGEVKINRFIREKAAELQITPFHLKSCLLKIALAESIGEFWEDDIKQASDVTPREIREYYRNYKREFQNFRHYLARPEGFNGNWARTEELALKISLALERGITFKELEISDFQELNYASFASFMPELQALLVALKDGEAGYVKSDAGFHVVQILSREPFETAQGKIETLLREQKINAKKQELIKKLRTRAVIEFKDPAILSEHYSKQAQITSFECLRYLDPQ